MTKETANQKLPRYKRMIKGFWILFR